MSVEWERTVEREAGFRRCLVIYGNVRDLWTSDDSRHLRLAQYISEILSDQFSIRGTWDSVDGLTFPDSAQLIEFNDQLQLAAGTTVEGDEYEEDIGTPPATSTSKTGCVHAPAIYRDANIAFPAMRQLLTSTSSTRSMFIIDWSEHLLTTVNQQDLEERSQLTNLAKAITEQPMAQMSSTAFNSATGLLVIISTVSSALPPRFYNYDSRIKLISIPTPHLESRRIALREMQTDFIFKGQSGDADSTELLAERTDGMTMVDLRNMAALSRQQEVPLSIDALVNLYRFGEKESPWSQLDEEKVARAGELIRQRVKGQDEAVDLVETMIIRAFLGLAGVQHSKQMTRPKGTLFFVGPTGVGKTELAKSIADFIFGDENNCIRFDMSEFSQEHADNRLIGAPPSFVGFEEGGQLTNAVAEKPFSVLLFEEIEKAHPKVLDKFLQIIDDGRLTDGRGQTAHFSETVIIFTSNIGAGEAKPEWKHDEVKAHFLEAVRGHFNDTLGRPELLNRFGDNIIVFDFINDPDIRSQILEAKLKGVREHLEENFNLALKIEEKDVQSLVAQGNVGHGGRGLVNVIERVIVNPMSLFIFKHYHQIGERQLTLNISFDKSGAAQFKLKE